VANRQRRRDGRRLHEPILNSHQRRGVQRRGIAGEQRWLRLGTLVARQKKLTSLDAFVLRVRGDGHRYKFTVRTESGFDTPIYQYQCVFTTKRDEWEEHRLPFKDFVPTFRGRVLTDVPPERYEGGAEKWRGQQRRTVTRRNVCSRRWDSKSKTMNANR